MFKSSRGASELSLLSLVDIANDDRWTFERQCRARAGAIYLGGRTALCRVMGRYKLYVATDDIGFGSHMLLDGLWEPWVTTFMARLVKPGMRVADVGANHGYFTLLMADLVGSEGAVAAFEPHPRTVELLRRSVAVNGFSSRVTIHDCAVMAEPGASLTFFSPAGEPKNARVIEQAREGTPTVQVRGDTLTNLLKGWPALDFIKMDVEGAEEGALLGARPLLEQHRPKLLLEYNALRCNDAAALLAWLKALYGAPRVLEFDSSLSPVTDEALLDRSRTEDWMLYYERA